MPDDLGIDTRFDVRTDTREGEDPDASSPTLKRYHQLLWDKPLPTGHRFSLATVSEGYLRHRSELGEFWMTSGAVVHTYRYWTRFGMPKITREIPTQQLDAFDALSYTIGGMMLFSSWTGVRHWSINRARGMITSIADRMDLTLKCIRRHYAGETAPLDKTLRWYDDFFTLSGYFQAIRASSSWTIF